jgi:hypothetical protein
MPSIDDNNHQKMASQLGTRRGEPDGLLAWAAVLVGLALAVHGLDHVRRGVHTLTTATVVAANLQAAVVVGTVLIVLMRHRLAPLVATVVGFGNAVGIAVTHFLPRWSVFSDSFIDPRAASGVTAMSSATAAIELALSVALGCVGLAALRRSAVTHARA